MISIISFMENADVIGKVNKNAYSDYCEFCKNNKFDAMSLHEFMYRVCSIWGYTTKQTAKGRVIIRKINNSYDKGVEIYLSEKDPDMFIGEDTNEIYLKYFENCNREGYPKLSKTEFSRRLCKELGITTKQKSVDGIRRYFFIERSV